jgi:hypothetical protein
MSTQPDASLAIDPNLLPQVQQTGGQLGLMRMLAQQSQVPSVEMMAPRSVGQGLAQGGIKFAENFMQARQTSQLRKMVEQQLAEQRDAMLKKQTLTSEVADELIKKGYPKAIAMQMAGSVEQVGSAYKQLQENETKQLEAAAKAKAEQDKWQSGFDSTKSVLGGFELESRIQQLQSLPPDQLAAQGELLGTMQAQLQSITALSQTAANNPSVAAEIAGRFLKEGMPLSSETESLVGQRLDNAGRVIGNTQAGFNLGQDQKYTDKKNEIGLLSDANNLNINYQNLTQEQAATQNALRKQQIMADPTLTPEQKAVQMSLVGGGANLLGKNLNDNAAGAVNDMGKEAGLFSIDPATGGYQKALPVPNFLGINQGPQQYIPVPGNPSNPLQQTGIQPPMQYGAPPPAALPAPMPGIGGGNPAPMPSAGGGNPAPMPILTPQQQGELQRQQMINSVGSSIKGGATGLGGFLGNVGGTIQGFTGLPYNPLDPSGGFQRALGWFK